MRVVSRGMRGVSMRAFLRVLQAAGPTMLLLLLLMLMPLVVVLLDMSRPTGQPAKPAIHPTPSTCTVSSE
jgi:hypothetical protein